MYALTLWQPWASLVSTGAKTIETRNWGTAFRGELAIHAAKRWDDELEELSQTWPFLDYLPIPDPAQLPRGCIVAVGHLYACVRMTPDWIEELERRCVGQDGELLHPEIHFGLYAPGRYAWCLRDVRAVEPVPARGAQRLWQWRAEEAHGQDR